MNDYVFDSEGSILLNTTQAIMTLYQITGVVLSERQMQSLFSVGKIRAKKSDKRWFAKREDVISYKPRSKL